MRKHYGGLWVIYLLQGSMKYHTSMRETAATQVELEKEGSFCLSSVWPPWCLLIWVVFNLTPLTEPERLHLSSWS